MAGDAPLSEHGPGPVGRSDAGQAPARHSPVSGNGPAPGPSLRQPREPSSPGRLRSPVRRPTDSDLPSMTNFGQCPWPNSSAKKAKKWWTKIKKLHKNIEKPKWSIIWHLALSSFIFLEITAH